jgi:hypothetical protein
VDAGLEPLDVQHLAPLNPCPQDSSHPGTDLVPPRLDLHHIEAPDAAPQSDLKSTQVDRGGVKPRREVGPRQAHASLRDAGYRADDVRGLRLSRVG